MKRFAIRFAGLAFSGSALAAAALALTGSAHAAPPNWAGYYIGFNGGAVEGTTNTGLGVINGPGPFYFTPGNIPAVVAGGTNQFNNTGSMFGGQFGYMLQAGNFVGGLEAAFDTMKLKGSVTTTNVYPFNVPNTFTFHESVGADWLLTLMMRGGLDWGAWYPYATVGAAFASLKYSNTFTDPGFCGNCPAVASQTQVVAGLAFGGGLEWRLDNHWSLRGEYLRIQFADDFNGTSSIVQILFPFVASFKHNATFAENIGRGFISYKW